MDGLKREAAGVEYVLARIGTARDHATDQMRGATNGDIEAATAARLPLTMLTLV